MDVSDVTTESVVRHEIDACRIALCMHVRCHGVMQMLRCMQHGPIVFCRRRIDCRRRLKLSAYLSARPERFSCVFRRIFHHVCAGVQHSERVGRIPFALGLALRTDHVRIYLLGLRGYAGQLCDVRVTLGQLLARLVHCCEVLRIVKHVCDDTDGLRGRVVVQLDDFR